MSLRDSSITYTVTLGEGTATIVRQGRRSPMVAQVLGQARLSDGRVRYWLDRRVHAGGRLQLNQDWEAEGAISTVLTGPPAPALGDAP